MARPEQMPPGALLVLGLGNPGPKYAGTRHNLGFLVVEELARRTGLSLGRSGHQSQWGQGHWQGRKLILALPQTYMNLSGQAAQGLMAYFDITPDRLVAVHDDLDLEPGRLKLALKGGSGGHKGVASLCQSLGTDQFIRLKVGIGRPRFGEAIEDFVLSGCYPDQRETLAQAVELAARCLEVIITQGPATAMQQFHRRETEDRAPAGGGEDGPGGNGPRT